MEIYTEIRNLFEKPTTIHDLIGTCDPFIPVGTFNGYFVEPNEVVLDTIQHNYSGEPARKLSETVTVKINQPDKLDITEGGRINYVSSHTALVLFNSTWYDLTFRRSSFGGSRVAAFLKHGAHRNEIKEMLLKVMKLHGVPDKVRTRIKDALDAETMSIEEAVGLLTDTQTAINHMDLYGIGHYGRDEVTADYIATRLTEELAPQLSHCDLDHINDHDEQDRVWRFLPPNILSSHILSSHKSLGEYHRAVPNLAFYLTDLRDSI